MLWKDLELGSPFIDVSAEKDKLLVYVPNCFRIFDRSKWKCSGKEERFGFDPGMRFSFLLHVQEPLQ